MEADLAGDSLLPEVGWSWLQESLDDAAAEHWALGGTVTRVQSESFAEMATREPEGRVQIRASWTAGDLSELPATCRPGLICWPRPAGWSRCRPASPCCGPADAGPTPPRASARVPVPTSPGAR